MPYALPLEFRCHSLSCVRLFAMPLTVACQALLSTEFCRQETLLKPIFFFSGEKKAKQDNLFQIINQLCHPLMSSPWGAVLGPPRSWTHFQQASLHLTLSPAQNLVCSSQNVLCFPLREGFWMGSSLCLIHMSTTLICQLCLSKELVCPSGFESDT